MKISKENVVDVLTSDGKKIGRVQEIGHDWILVYKKGLISNEEFHIPLSAIVKNESRNPPSQIALNLTEEQLKHGYEFLQAKPNSDFVHGRTKSEPKIMTEKQTIRYEPSIDADADNSLTQGSMPIPVNQDRINKQYSIPHYYECDMCKSQFHQPDQLQKHRAERHNAAVNI
jgi:hypothetical protein